VWCMHVCTHPRFHKCEIINVYAAQNAMTCAKDASMLGDERYGEMRAATFKAFCLDLDFRLSFRATTSQIEL